MQRQQLKKNISKNVNSKQSNQQNLQRIFAEKKKERKKITSDPARHQNKRQAQAPAMRGQSH